MKSPRLPSIIRIATVCLLMLAIGSAKSYGSPKSINAEFASMLGIPDTSTVQDSDTKFAFNVAFDSTSHFETLASYTINKFKVEQFLGSKMDFQIWGFAGATTDTSTSNGSASFTAGGAFVLHGPAAKNLNFNLGPKVTWNNDKAVWALLIGLELR